MTSVGVNTAGMMPMVQAGDFLLGDGVRSLYCCAARIAFGTPQPTNSIKRVFPGCGGLRGRSAEGGRG